MMVFFAELSTESFDTYFQVGLFSEALPLQISNKSWAEFELVQNLSLGFVKCSCATGISKLFSRSFHFNSWLLHSYILHKNTSYRNAIKIPTTVKPQWNFKKFLTRYISNLEHGISFISLFTKAQYFCRENLSSETLKDT